MRVTKPHPGKLRHGRPLALMAGCLLLAVTRLALADTSAIERGGDVFDEECAECHSLHPGRNKKGPSLFNVVGRQAGTESGYKYSHDLKQAGFVWTEEKIDAYITNPRKIAPGGRMKYEGLDDQAARADLLEFLKTQR